MALRFMVPVLAESFINLLVFMLCRPDIKSNPRLYENFVRSNIDVKIQSLHITALGSNLKLAGLRRSVLITAPL
jgi:hypothetical protein